MCWPPGPSSFGFSRESPVGDMWCYVAYVYNGELVSLIGNQRVGIFPPKSKILFVLSLALIWCQNFQDGSIPVGGDTWPSCTSERIIRIITGITCASGVSACGFTWTEFRKQWKALNCELCDSGRRSHYRRPTVKPRFWTFQAVWNNYEKSHGSCTRQWSEVTQPSADCQTTFFGRFKELGRILEEVSERSRDSGRRSRDRRPTVKQRFLDVSSN